MAGRETGGRIRGRAVSVEEEDYPAPLRFIFDPPEMLYVEGGGSWRRSFGGLAVGIVGARDATAAGLGMARSLARDLAAAGVTVVSGLALGIDAAAHAGALEAGGDTVAVLGCGTDVVYPRRNRSVRDRIAETGLLASEWPPGTDPRPHYFPMRNRIISGLCLGVVVVEATERSGSLITARLALEQGREVFAVPGPPGAPRSRGPHGLLKEGARLVENVHDVLDELPLDSLGSFATVEESQGPRARLLEAVLDGAQTVDAMVEKTGRKTQEIWADLLELEVRGAVVRGAGGRFAPGGSAGSRGRSVGSAGLDSDARGELGAPPTAKE